MSRKIYISYIFLLLLFAVFSFLFIDPNFAYLNLLYSGFYSQHSSITTILFTLFITSFFIFYLFFIMLFNHKHLKLDDLKKLILLTVILLVFSYPAMLSFDIFNYTTTSKVMFLYKENPYTVMPIEFLDDDFLSYTRAANKTALYGPVWILLTAIPFVVGMGNTLLTLLSLKFLIVLFYFITAYVTWRITENIFSVLLFALNPLVLIETVVSGHNDVVMICFALASFYLLQKKRIGYSFLFLLLSVGIKYATVFLLPLWLFVAWRIYIKRTIKWDIVFFYAVILMSTVFALAPIREEIYPWYWIWVWSFIVLISKNKPLLFAGILFSFSLMLRYIPYMLTGSYFGQSPLVKELLTFTPITIYLGYLGYKLFLNRYINR